MKIMLTNDDGLEAPGIQTLKKVLSKKHQVFIVAPDSQRSASGHGVTLMDKLTLQKVRNDEYACSGLPADCALMGLCHIYKDNRPDLVISGINKGANLGVDTYYSGTAAAAREACIRHVPAIAVSNCCDFYSEDKEHIYFETAANFIDKCIDAGIVDYIGEYEYANINVPNLPESEIEGVALSSMGFRVFTSAYEEVEKNKFYYRSNATDYIERGDCDCKAIATHKISISPLNIFDGAADKEAWRQFIDTLM